MGDSNKLKSILLEAATTEQQKEFVRMLAEQGAVADLQIKGHRCWFFVPSQNEMERMKEFNQSPDYDKCPKCKRGRIVIEIFRDTLGDSWHAVCRFGNKSCDFKKYISDDL